MLIGIGLGIPEGSLVPDFPDAWWFAASPDEVNSLLDEVPAGGWVFLLGPDERVEEDETLALALKLIQAREMAVGDAVGLRVLTCAGQTVEVDEVHARAWPCGTGITLTAEGAPSRDGKPLREITCVDGTRIVRASGPSHFLQGNQSKTNHVDLPDPLPAAHQLQRTPLAPSAWLDLLSTATVGLALCAEAIVRGYPTTASSEVLDRTAHTLRHLAGVGLISPPGPIHDIADAIRARTSVVTPAGSHFGSAGSSTADVDLGAALTGSCFVPSVGVRAEGYARDLEALGMLPIPQEAARTVLALGRPVLFFSYSEATRRLGLDHPGLVHVLWLDNQAEGTLGQALKANASGQVRLWKTAWSDVAAPSVTGLPIVWSPPAFEGEVVRQKGTVLIPEADAGLVLDAARTTTWKTIYAPDTLPAHLADTVADLSGDRTVLVRLPFNNEAEVAEAMRSVEAVSTRLLSWKILGLLVLQPQDAPLTQVGVQVFLARGGFALETVRRPLQFHNKRVLLVADEEGWSFDVNLAAIEKMLAATGIKTERWYAGTGEASLPPLDYDAYYVSYMTPMAWRLPPHKVLGSLRMQWFNPAQPGPPGTLEWSYLRRCAGFAVANSKTLSEFRAFGADDRVVCLSNPVDMARFPAATKVTDVVACWAGNRQHLSDARGDAKGIRTIIEPACTAAGVSLNLAVRGKEQIPPEDMDGFYCEASVYISASAHEGASNSIMEAMASGLAVISTDVGNVREMRDAQVEHFGESGITIVERSVEAFTAALQNMDESAVAHMGKLNRLEIEARWTTEAWAQRYINFFARVL
jgi:hypothetical protein